MEELWTLGSGKRKRKFKADFRSGDFLTIKTGKLSYGMKLSRSDYGDMIEYFRGREEFRLGNQIDNVYKGGLGEYFQKELKKSPKYASHFARILVGDL